MSLARQTSGRQARIGRARTCWLLAASLLGAAAYLYLSLFRLPHTPFLLGGDQVYFWMYAQRLLHGEQIYRDFFQFTPPGADLVYAALFRLFGLRLWVTNATVLLLGVSLFWVCLAIAGELMRRSAALLTAALFLVITYGKMLNGTHHWFAMLAILCAVKLNMKAATTGRLLAAGALLGLASFFTQTHGALALFGFLVFLACERLHAKKSWKTMLQAQSLLLLGFLASLLLLSAHFIAADGLKQLWYFQFVYVRQYLGPGTQGSLLGLPQILTRHSLPALSQYLIVYAAVFAAYPIALFQCWRERQNPLFPWHQATLVSIVGLALLLELLFSLNWLRLYALSMPAIILLAWLTTQTLQRIRPAALVLWPSLFCLVIAQTVSRYRHQPFIARLPAGTTAASAPQYEKLQWFAEHTHPGQFVFQAAWPGIYLPLHLRNPAYVDILVPAIGVRPADIPQTIQQLDARQVRYVLWSPTLDMTPDTTGPSAAAILPLRHYLHSHYFRIKVFADGDSAWQRNDPASSASMATFPASSSSAPKPAAPDAAAAAPR